MKKLTAILCAVLIALGTLTVSVGINPFAALAASDILTEGEIIEKLKNTDAYSESAGVLTSLAGKAGKNAMLTGEQDFELKFTVSVPAGASGSLQIRMRSADVTGHSVGYRAWISAGSISLHKFNDTNWQSTELKSVSHDFTKKTVVSITADGKSLKISLNGKTKIEIADAVDTSADKGELRLYGTDSAGFTLEALSLTEPADNSGDGDMDDNGSTESGKDILASDEITNALKNTGAYSESAGVLTSLAGKAGKNAMLTGKQDFELKFTVSVPAGASGSLQIRMRSADVSGHSVGYRAWISAGSISLHKFNDTNWQSTELKSVSHDFTKKTVVSITADGKSLKISLNGKTEIEIADAVDTSADKGELRLYGTDSAGFTLEALSLTEPADNSGDGDKDEGEAGDSGTDKPSEGGNENPPDTSGLDELNKKLVNSGAYTLDGDIIKSVVGKAAASATVCEKQDFILDFEVKMNSASAAGDYMQLRLRTANLSNHSLGYRIYIFKDRIQLDKFNEDNWNSTALKTVDHDFTENTRVRIAASGSNLWIALDGTKAIVLTDAVDTAENKGQLCVMGVQSSVQSEIKILSVKDYGLAEAEDGIVTPVVDESVIMSKAELDSALVRAGAYTLDGEALKSVSGVPSKSTGLEAQSFIFDFEVKLDSASDINDHLQLRLRSNDRKSNSVGYRLLIYKDRIQLDKFNDNNWQSTLLKSADHDFTVNTRVRIAADGNDLWIALDGIKTIALTDAVDTSADKGQLRLYGFNGKGSCTLKMGAVTKYSAEKAANGITEPVIDKSTVKSGDELTNALVRSGAYVLNGNTVNSVKGVPAKCATFAEVQDFIFNFSIKLKTESYGDYVQIRLRSADLKKNSVGYRLYIYRDRVVLEKFRDDSWKSDLITYADHDFTENTRVRIAANGSKLWIALDGVKVLEITDAVDTTEQKGAIRFYGVQGECPAEVEMTSLRVYNATEAEDGIKAAEKTEADVIMTSDKMINALVRSGAYVLNGDKLANVPNTDSKGCSLTDEQNFILNFKLKMAEKASGSLQIRIRSKNLEKNSLGYRVFISKNKLEIAKFNDNNWASKTVKSIKHSFTDMSEIRIVANGSVIWIAVDGKKLIEIEDAVTVDGGAVSIYGLGTNEPCELVPISLLKYSAAKAEDGVTVPENASDDDSKVLKPLRAAGTQGNKADTDTANTATEENTSSVAVIIVVSVCAAAVVAAAVILPICLRKKAKGKNR